MVTAWEGSQALGATVVMVDGKGVERCAGCARQGGAHPNGTVGRVANGGPTSTTWRVEQRGTRAIKHGWEREYGR